MSLPEVPPPTRRVTLDALRGLAILLVLGRHLPPVLLSNPILAIWQRLGWTGVDLFFVLSGFLVGGLLFAEHHKYRRLDLPRFFIRRVFKIFPPYFAFLIFGAMLIGMEYSGSPGERIASVISRLGANLLCVQNYAGTPLAHTWSLAVEEHFYLLLPALLLILIRSRRDDDDPFRAVPRIAVAMLVACLVARIATATAGPFNWRTNMSPTHLRIDSLFAGVALAYFSIVHPAKLRRLARVRSLFPIFAVARFAPAAILDVETSPFIYTWGLTLLTFGSTTLVLWAWLEPEESARRSLAYRSIAHIGVRSYSIYLWHAPLSLMLSTAVIPASQPVAMFFTFLAVAILPGLLMYRLIEVPSLHARDAVLRFRSRASSQLPATVTA